MFDLWQSIKDTFTGLLNDLVTSWLQELQTALGNLIQTSFYIEKMPGLTAGVLTDATVDAALSAMYYSVVGLLTLKLCWKGYKVHVLWLDGDSEVSPFSFFTRAMYALAVALAFPVLYDIAIDIVIALCDKVINVFNSAAADNLISVIIRLLTPLLSNNVSAFMILLSLVFVIVFVILAIQMIVRGAEMLIYRLGVPLAVIGLIDSDGGIWKSYIAIFFRQLATIMIQYFCISIAVRLLTAMTTASLIGAIVFLITAFKMPKLLSSILVPSGGGSNAMYTVMMVARSFIGGA